MAGSKLPSDDNVKSPNFIERAKEEIQAVIHSDKLHLHRKKPEINENTPIDRVKAPNVFDRAKEEIEALVQTIHPEKNPKSDHQTEEGEAIGHRNHHHRETHGRRDDIDENTPMDEIRGPSIFQRAKEEVEAVIGTMHRKKDSGEGVCPSPPAKEGGFRAKIGRGLEKVCSAEIGASIGRGLEKVCSPAKNSKTH